MVGRAVDAGSFGWERASTPCKGWGLFGTAPREALKLQRETGGHSWRRCGRNMARMRHYDPNENTWGIRSWSRRKGHVGDGGGLWGLRSADGPTAAKAVASAREPPGPWTRRRRELRSSPPSARPWSVAASNVPPRPDRSCDPNDGLAAASRGRWPRFGIGRQHARSAPSASSGVTMDQLRRRLSGPGHQPGPPLAAAKASARTASHQPGDRPLPVGMQKVTRFRQPALS